MSKGDRIEREQAEAALGLAVEGFERKILEQPEFRMVAEFMVTRDGHTPDFAVEPTYFDNNDGTTNIGVRLGFVRPGDDSERAQYISIATVDVATLSEIHGEHELRSYRARLEESGQEPTDELVGSAIAHWRDAWNHIQADLGDSLAVDPFYDTLILASDLEARTEIFDDTLDGIMRIFREVLDEDDLHILDQEFLVNGQISDLDGVLDYVTGKLFEVEGVDDPFEVLERYGIL